KPVSLRIDTGGLPSVVTSPVSLWWGQGAVSVAAALCLVFGTTQANRNLKIALQNYTLSAQGGIHEDDPVFDDGRSNLVVDRLFEFTHCLQNAFRHGGRHQNRDGEEHRDH